MAFARFKVGQLVDVRLREVAILPGDWSKGWDGGVVESVTRSAKGYFYVVNGRQFHESDVFHADS